MVKISAELQKLSQNKTGYPFFLDHLVVGPKYCFALSFCSSFLVDLLHDFQVFTLTSKFFNLEVMTSWKFRSIENPASELPQDYKSDTSPLNYRATDV